MDASAPSASVEHGPRAKFARWLPDLVARLTLLVLPATVILAAGARIATPENGIDEHIYIGTVERLSDFIGRWPNTYYPYRFGYIFPELVAERILGPELGFLALRFGILGVITLMLRRWFGGWAAGAGGLFVAMSPIVLRGLLDTYVDSLTLGFLLVGTLMLVGLTPTSQWARSQAFGAGVVLSLAIHANIAIVVIVAVVGVVFFVDSLIQGLRTVGDRPAQRAGVSGEILNSALVVAGMVAVGLIGAVFYQARYGVWNIWDTSFNEASALANDIFIDKNPRWFTWRHYLLLAPLSWVAGTIVWFTDRRPLVRSGVRRLLGFAVAATAIYGYFQWVVGQPVLSVFYYSVFPLGLCVLLLGFCIAAGLTADSDSRDGYWWALLALFTVGSFLASTALGLVEFRWLVMAALCVVVTIAALAFAPRRLGLAVAVVVLMASWVSVSSPNDFEGASPTFRLDPRYESAFFSYSRDGLNSNAVSREFAAALPSLPSERGELLVWFDGQGATHQVLSTLVHYLSALQAPGEPFLPEVTDTVVQRLVERRPRFVVLLAGVQENATTGIQRLEDMGQPYGLVDQQVISEGAYTVYVVLLERTDGEWRDFPCSESDLEPTKVCPD